MTRFYQIVFCLVLSLLGLHSALAQENSDRKVLELEYFYDQDLLPADFHKERREALRTLLPDNSVAVIFAYPRKRRSNDIFYEYHPNPDLYSR